MAAPVLLTLVRLLQGISIGGQLVGTFVQAVETAKEGEKILKGAYTLAGASLGTTLGSAVAAILEVTLRRNSEADVLLFVGMTAFFFFS